MAAPRAGTWRVLQGCRCAGMRWWCGAAAGCWPPPLRAGEGSGPGAGAKAAVARRGLETPALPHSRGCTRLGVTPGSPTATCELSVATWARPRACAAECPLSAPFSQDPPGGPLAACPEPRALRGGSAALFEGSARDTSGLCEVRGTLVLPSLERGVESSPCFPLGRGLYSRGPSSAHFLSPLPLPA